MVHAGAGTTDLRLKCSSLSKIHQLTLSPRPSDRLEHREFHVARAVKAPRDGTRLSQANRIARPITARTADMVRTSAPSIRTTLLSTSAQANEGGAEHGRADLRRTTADVRRRELVHGNEVLRGTT